jgi:MtrB/PioB family decaheme-associated outer membrane protein
LTVLVTPRTQAQEEERFESSGGIATGPQGVDVDSNSSKFNEYRDVRDGFYLYSLWFDFLDTESGFFMDFRGENVIRDDQFLRFRVGDYGSWNIVIDRNEIPHNLSNKAAVPFIGQGGGLFTLPTTVQTPNPDLTPSAAELLENDPATAAWLATHLRDTELGSQRRKTSGRFQYSPREDFRFQLSASDESREGSNITYGPIGDRPPRTLNIQLTEPIDYTTRELRIEADYRRPNYQALITYLFSDFGNDVQALRWQNGYTRLTSADSGFDQWADHRIGTFGQRALAPNNSYHNASISLGFDLPQASRLTATAAFGWMRQDETLLPYSTSDFDGTEIDFTSITALPRQQADAEIHTALFNVDYIVNPIDRLNLRPFFRYYNLDNDTPQDNWWYITSDTIPGTPSSAVGTPTFKNQRITLAYSYDQATLGLDATYYLTPWRTTLGLRFEREDIDRDFREANTKENIFKASVRTRPSRWLNFRVKYLFGDREGDGYNTFVTSQSYWYDAVADAAGNLDNPKVSFTNHPDMRKFDVAGRQRNEVDLAATILPRETLNLSASFLFRDDDLDSNVTSTQPLLGNTFAATAADQVASTPGDQLGLLKRETQRYALDVSYAPTDRLTVTAFGSRENMDLNERGLEYQENNKLDAASNVGLQSNELGPWTRATNQWLAETDDTINTVGFGLDYEIIPAKVRLIGDYVRSRGTIDVHYSGFGTQSGLDPTQTFPDDFQYAFRTPPTVRNNQDTLDASLEYQWQENVVVGLHYIFDRYRLSDWMQEDNTPWVESVGSEFLLRDTSAPTSTQWGNRLVNMGSFLAPSYDAHVLYATIDYRF